MRATISFEIDVDQVDPTMGVLAAQEAVNLRVIADVLESTTKTGPEFAKELTEALGLLASTGRQLSQYRDMVLSFQKAKMETLLPQPAPEATLGTAPGHPPAIPDRLPATPDVSEVLASFGSFMDKMPKEDLEDESESSEEG